MALVAHLDKLSMNNPSTGLTVVNRIMNTTSTGASTIFRNNSTGIIVEVLVNTYTITLPVLSSLNNGAKLEFLVNVDVAGGNIVITCPDGALIHGGIQSAEAANSNNGLIAAPSTNINLVAAQPTFAIYIRLIKYGSFWFAHGTSKLLASATFT